MLMVIKRKTLMIALQIAAVDVCIVITIIELVVGTELPLKYLGTKPPFRLTEVILNLLFQ